MGNNHKTSEGSTYRITNNSINNSNNTQLTNEPSYIRFRPDTNQKELNFLVDTGADICLVKASSLRRSTVLGDSLDNTLTGITGQPISPIGIYNAQIDFKGNRITHKFLVVPEEFKLNPFINGIIGRDFLKKYKANISYDKNIVSIEINSKQIQIPLESKFGSNAANPTNSDVIHTSVQPTEQNSKEIILKHVLAVDKPMQLAEEKIFINKIIDHFQDIFHIMGDRLSCSSRETHKLPLKENIPPIHIRQYRLAESHKNEVNEQTKKMLEDNIIRHSNSPWNSPLLVVPKKADAQGNKKVPRP